MPSHRVDLERLRRDPMTIRRSRGARFRPGWRRVLAALGSVLLLVPSLAMAAEPPGAATPQALVERMMAAAEAGDFAEMAACLAPEERAEMTLGMLAMTGMMIGFMQMGGEMATGMAEGMSEALTDEEMSAEQKAELERAEKEMSAKSKALEERFQAVLEEHGLADLMADDEGGGGDESSPSEMFEGVDQGALLADLMALMQELGEATGEEADEAPVDVPGEVTSYEIEGDRATAKADDGEVLRFVRVDGRWYLTQAEPAGPTPEAPGNEH